MPHLLLKDLPRYECLLEASKRYPELDPSACEAFLHLLRTADEASLYIEENFADHGISQGRFGVLMQLWGACQVGCSPIDGLTPAELAERTCVTRATITGLIDTLERDGYVSRTADTEDRRMMHVCLTPKARDLMQRLLPLHFRRMACLMEPLSEAERKTLVALMGKLLQHAAALAQSPTDSAPCAVAAPAV